MLKRRLLIIALSLAVVVLLFLLFPAQKDGIFSPPSEELRPENWIDIVARSAGANAGQVYAIPTRYTMIADEWLFEEDPSHYLREDLLRQLTRYGTTLDNFLKRMGDKVLSVNGDVFKISMGQIMHRHPYDYDINVPIIFYGPTYINAGVYDRYITHQHIVPTVASIIGGPIPKGTMGRPVIEVFSPAVSKRRPKVVVLIVLDAGGDQYYWAHPKATPTISKIRAEGADFTNAQISHLDVETGTGHAAIGTGSYPANSLVYGNSVWRLEDGRDSSLYKVHGSYAPFDLKVPTLADEYDKAVKNKAIIISYCYAPRATIGMGGHGSGYKGGDKDQVLWVSSKTFKLATNTDFYAPLPNIPFTDNVAENFKNSYPAGEWMEHKIIGDDGSFDEYEIFGSPAQVRWEGDLILHLLNSNPVGKDDITDLIFVTFKTTDQIGHQFGWESLEAKEVLGETDRQIARVKEWLDKNVPDDYVMVITADHGAAPMTEFSGGLKVNINDIIKDINNRFDPEGKRILKFAAGNHYLFDEERMKELGVIYEDVRTFFMGYRKDGQAVFAKVFLKPEIEARQRELLKQK